MNSTIRCVIYRCSNKDEMYLYVPFQEQEENLLAGLPPGLHDLTGRLDKVMELELTADRKLARVKAGDVIAALSDKGFYLQMPPNEVIRTDRSMLREDSDSF